MDHVYDHMYTNLTQGRRYGIWEKHLMVVLKDGALLGLICGMQRPIIKFNALMALRGVMPDNHIKIDLIKLKGTKEHSHAYLDSLTPLAHEQGFPLAYIDFAPHVTCRQEVSPEGFNDLIDTLRSSVNRGTWTH